MKTNKLKRMLCATLLGAALVQPCAAQDNNATTDAVARQLKVNYPATSFGAVNTTAWPGVYEVALGGNLAYVDATGQYFLFGHLYDMKAQRDLTAERRDTLNRIDFTSLPLEDALTQVRGSGARTLVIFSDPDCPYCRRLEADIAGLTDVTIHTFLLPIASLHPQARAKAINVWCASDRVAAWQALMLKGETVASPACDHPIDRTIALAERLRISGTPTLIAADGRVMPGAASVAQIEDWLARTTTAGASNPAGAPQ